MMWVKAWRESRTRFLIGVTCLATLTIVVAFVGGRLLDRFDFATRLTNGGEYRDVIMRRVFDGIVKGFFAIFALFLGLGGLLREKERLTVQFTLALPTTRREMVAIRAAAGLLQVCVLAFVPSLLVLIVSPLVHQTYPSANAMRFALLWAVGGSVIFGMSFFLSTLFSGEFTALVMTWVIVVGHALLAAWPPLVRYHLNVMQMMGGWRIVFRGADRELQFGPLPWIRLLIVALIAITLLLLSVERVQREDF
jgi:ABC-2 type transport system permease protein